MDQGSLPAVKAYVDALRAQSYLPDKSGLPTISPKALAAALAESSRRWEDIARRAAALLTKYSDSADLDPTEEIALVEEFVLSESEWQRQYASRSQGVFSPPTL